MASRARKQKHGPTQKELAAWLGRMEREELVARVLQGGKISTKFREELRAEYRMAHGQHSQTVAAIESEIEDLTSEEVWYDSWRDQGEVLDYSGLQSRLEALRKAGMHEELLDLGCLLYEKGMVQVDQAHDEGETGMEIEGCLSVAFASLRQAERPLVSRLLLALDLIRRDGYGILPRMVRNFVDQQNSQAAWSEVADRLRATLGKPGDMSQYGQRARRRKLTDQIAAALDHSERQSEATELLRSEAPITQDHLRLVDRLISLGDHEAAETAAREGLTHGDGSRFGSNFGSKQRLRERLRDLAKRSGNHYGAAAYTAAAFFRRATTQSFFELLEAAKAARCEKMVRPWLELFLETGRCPAQQGFKKRRGDPAAWPLPRTGEEVQPSWTPTEGLSLLRDIAIEESHPILALRYHDRLRALPAGEHAATKGNADLRVAEAIAATKPRRAIEIYLRAAQEVISETKPKLYPHAVSLLDRIRVLLGPGKKHEFDQLLAQLRSEHRHKRRFLQELDQLPLPSRSNRRRSRARHA